MNKSSSTTPPSRGQQPYTPRRTNSTTTTPSQRPSTSAGDSIEPKSDFLREALRERKGQPQLQQRARSTTPRRVRPNTSGQSHRDEWLQSSEDEAGLSRSASLRPQRPRRISDLNAAKAASPASASRVSLPSREADQKLDKLEKENWDLKHRIMLYQDRARQLNRKLEEKEEELESARSLRERNEDLVEENEQLRKRVEEQDYENMQLRENNLELTDINEELVRELSVRVDELESLERDTDARQSAIEEAAGIIQELETQVEQLQLLSRQNRKSLSPPRTDSDYFSGDAEVAHPGVTKTPPAKAPSASQSADSDYFSADTSPQATPKTPRRASLQHPEADQDQPRRDPAVQKTVTFDREVGIRSITSKDSLFSAFLESPRLPQKTLTISRLLPLRSLRRRAGQAVLPAYASTSGNAEDHRNDTPRPWHHSRPLGSLHATGELGPQINCNTNPVPRAIGPSEMTSRQGPYSSSSPDDDAFNKIKSKSTTSIPAADTVNTRVANAAPKNVAMTAPSKHSRSNSTFANEQSSLARANTTPSKTRRPLSQHGSSSKPLPPTPSISYSSTTSNNIHSTAPAPLQLSVQTPSLSSSIKSASSSGKPTPPQKHVRPVSMLSYTTPPAQSAPTYSSTKPTSQTHRSPPTPNYAIWPRRYPAWPPSAGLINRDLLFHGDGMDEVFGGDDEDPGTHW